MSIVPITGLSPEAEEIQQRAIQAVKTRLPELVAEYRKRFGINVGTDLARGLFPEYAESVESRLKYAAAVQRPAAALADAVFDQILSESNGGSVLFTAGGTGAGKTTAISRDGVAQRALQAASVIFDSNFNSLKSSKAKVDAALKAGCKVVVIFVHRHPVESYLEGVLPRALEQGRTVPIDGHLRMHKDSRKTFLKMTKSFASNNDVSFMVLSNTGHESEAFPADVDYLKSVQYDEVAVVEAIREGLDHALNQQTISQTLYAASCGSSGV